MIQAIVVALVFMYGLYLTIETTVIRSRDGYEPYMWLDTTALACSSLILLLLRIIDFILCDWWLAIAPLVGTFILQLLYMGIVYTCSYLIKRIEETE